VVPRDSGRGGVAVLGGGGSGGGVLIRIDSGGRENIGGGWGAGLVERKLLCVGFIF